LLPVQNARAPSLNASRRLGALYGLAWLSQYAFSRGVIWCLSVGLVRPVSSAQGGRCLWTRLGRVSTISAAPWPLPAPQTRGDSCPAHPGTAPRIAGDRAAS